LKTLQNQPKKNHKPFLGCKNKDFTNESDYLYNILLQKVREKIIYPKKIACIDCFTPQFLIILQTENQNIRLP